MPVKGYACKTNEAIKNHKLEIKDIPWKRKKVKKKNLRLIGMETVDFYEHFRGMFRTQMQNMYGGNLRFHNARKWLRRSYKVLLCHGLVSKDGFTPSRI